MFVTERFIVIRTWQVTSYADLIDLVHAEALREHIIQYIIVKSRSQTVVASSALAAPGCAPGPIVVTVVAVFSGCSMIVKLCLGMGVSSPKVCRIREMTGSAA